MRTTDPWGVDSGYEDTSDQWHETTAETRRAIHAAMGVTEDAAGPGGPDPVRVVRQGTVIAWPQAGELRLEDGEVLRIRDRLPGDLPLGYHVFQPDVGGTPTWVIVSPGQCVRPDPAWGWAVQLYATRSPESWGMGDLADLRRLAAWSKELGAGYLLLNPLGAVAPVISQQASPYYPTSRRFLNPLYLRVEEVPGANELGPDLDRLAEAGRALNAQCAIDRDAVFNLKQEALERIWNRFQGDDDFDRFRKQYGVDLEHFAAYCALTKHHGGDWRTWPAEFHDPRGEAVRQFVEEHRREVDYHKWLQWLLERQLAEAAYATPLVYDLPIGVDPGGADAWMWQGLLATSCTIGAPPDLFNMQGQNWMLPPFVPHKLRAAGYEPLVKTIRSSLRHAGGLRIDHVMGLFRLYWIPQGFGPAQGAYVRYRFDEILAIVALESQRAGAFVVGEDLGTVEPQVREELASRNILSFRVLWFEDRPTSEYPELAMAAVSTHDLPTIAGLWTGKDIERLRAAGLDVGDAMHQLRRNFASVIGADENASVPEVIEQGYRTLGEAPSLLLVATLEDAVAVTERPNVPGTTIQCPNWCLSLPGGLETLESSELPRKIAQSLRRSQVADASRR